MKQEVSQFQQKIDTELEKHKSHLDEVFQDFSARIETNRELDEGFKESVVEHLRLARDEGARITATAMAEAEELTKTEKAETAEVAPAVELGDIRDAIYDISSQNSQSAILKSLINHAAKFTPRGAFFVVKNQHFVGWRVFGKQENLEDDAITEIVFSTSAATALGESVRSLSVVESSFGTYPDDADYLRQLDFGQPETMFAIPLIARGRGVAAIYADNGDNNEQVNVEALETLVSVAGLTVELLAAAQSSNYTREPVRASSYVAAAPAAESSQTQLEEPETAAVDDYRQEEEVESKYDYAVEEVETTSEEQAEEDEFVVERTEVVEETVSFYYKEPETSEEEETEPEETYALEESDIQEVEVAEPFSYQETEEDEEDEYEPVYEVSDEFETSETEPETAEEESYSFSSEEETPESEEIESDYAVYDDDLIEEVQSQPETSAAEEEVEAVYEETPATEETQPAETEETEAETAEETAEAEEKTEETAETAWSQPDEVIEEVSPSYATETDSSRYDSEVEAVEPTDATDDFSTTPAHQYPEFETNQDFNSSPVQFEETVEAVETTDYEYSEPVVEAVEEIEEVGEAEEVEEVSLSDSEPDEVTEVKEEESTTIEQPPVFAAPMGTTPIRTRFSERNVDLPIEVSEEERRLHNDARRFARLLVSEIKLYNEQKVKEGRDAHDLYERLREAIDRSREMYDKRVQPTVVERFDYFHYEVVNTLAEGEESKLGTTYPGAIS